MENNLKYNNNPNDPRINSTKSIFSSSFYFEDFYDDKSLMKFIKSIESMIRKSREYKTYISSLSTVSSGLARDNILSNIAVGDACIEFHHYPFDLKTIVEMVIMSHISRHDKFTSFSLCHEILDLHYRNLIGLVPLSSTSHELVHLNSILIKSDQIFGDWRKLLEIYHDGISIEQEEKIKELDEISTTNIPSDYLGIFDNGL